jgi:hypothetical protein
MAKILSIDDMLEAAATCELPGYAEHVSYLEDAAHALAKALANHFDLNQGDTTWEGKTKGGLCACFYPKRKGQACPDVIDAGDPGGDWDDDEVEEE